MTGPPIIQLGPVNLADLERLIAALHDRAELTGDQHDSSLLAHFQMIRMTHPLDWS